MPASRSVPHSLPVPNRNREDILPVVSLFLFVNNLAQASETKAVVASVRGAPPAISPVTRPKTGRSPVFASPRETSGAQGIVEISLLPVLRFSTSRGGSTRPHHARRGSQVFGVRMSPQPLADPGLDRRNAGASEERVLCRRPVAGDGAVPEPQARPAAVSRRRGGRRQDGDRQGSGRFARPQADPPPVLRRPRRRDRGLRMELSRTDDGDSALRGGG